MDKIQISELLTWWARQSVEIQQQVMSLKDMTELAQKIEQVRELTQDTSDFDLHKKKGGWQSHRDKPKFEQVQARMELIANLRSRGYGWLLISRYLAKYHKISITPAYIRRAYIKLGGQDVRAGGS